MNPEDGEAVPTTQQMARSLTRPEAGHPGWAVLLLAAAGLLLGLLVVEVATRVLVPLPPSSFLNLDPVLGTFHEPRASGRWTNLQREFDTLVTINSKGLRDREFTYEKPGGAFRVLALGDSFVEALQVNLEDTFSKRLEALLDANRPDGYPAYEIINAGVSGYATDNELLLYLNEGQKYQPDLVLLTLLPNNDILDNSYALGGGRPYFTLEGSELVLHSEAPAVGPARESLFRAVRGWLHRHLKVYRIAADAAVRNTRMRQVLRDAGLLGITNLDVPGDYLREYVLFGPDLSGEFQDAWELTQALLLRLRQEARQRQARFAVVLIPYAFQVYPDRWEAILREYPPMQGKAWDLSKPDRMVMQFLDQHEIPYIHLLPIMEAEAVRGASLYFSHDGHLNEAGHQVVARAIYEFLLNKHLLQ